MFTRTRVLTLIILILAGTSAWLGYVVATPAPSRSTTVEPGWSQADCTDNIYLDGTTPVDHPGNGGANNVGTAGQDFGAYINGRMGAGKKLCLEPTTTFTATSCLTVTNSNMIIDGNGATITMSTSGVGNIICANPVLANSYSNLTFANINFVETFTTPCSCIGSAFTGNYHNVLWFNDNFTVTGGNVVFSSITNVASVTKVTVDSDITFYHSKFKMNNGFLNTGNTVTALGRNVQFIDDVINSPGGGGAGLIFYGFSRQGIDGPMSVEHSRIGPCATNGGCEPIVVEDVFGAQIIGNNINATGTAITIQQNADTPASANANFEVTISENILDLWCTASEQPSGIAVSSPVGGSPTNNMWIRGVISNNQFFINNPGTCSGVFPCLNFNGGGVFDVSANGNVCRGFSGTMQFGGTIADKNMTITNNDFTASSTVYLNTVIPVNILIEGNIFPAGVGSSSSPSAANAWSGFTFRNNVNLNPVGKITNPFSGTVMGLVGSGSSPVATPVASTNYVVTGYDLFITSTGGTGVSITIQDNLGNTIASSLTTLTDQYIPIGYKLNFGGFSVAPTVTVFAN